MSQAFSSQSSTSDSYTINFQGGTSYTFKKVSDKELDYTVAGSTLRLWKDGASPLSPPSWLIGTWSDDLGFTTWTFTSSTAKSSSGDVTSLFLSQSSTSTTYSLTYGAATLQQQVKFELQGDGKSLKVTQGGSTDTLKKKSN